MSTYTTGPAVVLLNDEQWDEFMSVMQNPKPPTETFLRGAALLQQLIAERCKHFWSLAGDGTRECLWCATRTALDGAEAKPAK